MGGDSVDNMARPSLAPVGAATFQVAPGVSLAALDAGTRACSYLARLPDGRQFQLTEKLYHLLQCLHSPLTVLDLRVALQERLGAAPDEGQLAELCARRLLSSGLLTSSLAPLPALGGASRKQTVPHDRASVLALHWRRDLLPPDALAPLAGALGAAFSPRVAVPLLAAVAVAHTAVYPRLGFPPALDAATVSMPLLSLLLLASVAVHEMGHLAACRRWGCAHGPLGVGLYFLSPVVYVDTSPSWALSRWRRVAVDAGGIYLQLACTIALALGYWATANPTLGWAVVLIDAMVLTNLNPLVKFDGYWLLSDALAVPNLHRRTAETLSFAGAWLLWRLGRRARRPALSPFARVGGVARLALPAYAVLCLVLWACLFVLVVPALVRGAASFPSLWAADLSRAGAALAARTVPALAGALGGLVVPALIVANGVIVLLRLLSAVARVVQRLAMGRLPGRFARPLSLAAATGVLAGGGMAALALSAAVRPALPLGPEMGGLAVGLPAPAFRASDLQGRSVDWHAFRERRVFLKFWSPTCPYCRAEIPAMRAAYRGRGQDMTFLTVVPRMPTGALTAFVRRQHIDYPVIADEGGAIARLYAIKALPFAYVIAPSGVVERTIVGVGTPQGPQRPGTACSARCAGASVP